MSYCSFCNRFDISFFSLAMRNKICIKTIRFISSKIKDIINRSEFNALMKYENVEFERNFQLNPTVQPTDEPSDSASSSVCAQSQTEKSHDDIQVFLRERIIKIAMKSWRFFQLSKFTRCVFGLSSGLSKACLDVFF